MLLSRAYLQPNHWCSHVIQKSDDLCSLGRDRNDTLHLSWVIIFSAFTLQCVLCHLYKNIRNVFLGSSCALHNLMKLVWSVEPGMDLKVSVCSVICRISVSPSLRHCTWRKSQLIFRYDIWNLVLGQQLENAKAKAYLEWLSLLFIIVLINSSIIWSQTYLQFRIRLCYFSITVSNQHDPGNVF